MKDNIRWLVSLILSLLFVWVLFRVDQSLPNFLNKVFTYGAAAVFVSVLSEVIYSELGKLQVKAEKVLVRNKDAE